MTIKKALFYQIRDIRVTCGDRWLVWNGKEWVVYERKRHAKTTKTVTVPKQILSYNSSFTCPYRQM